RLRREQREAEERRGGLAREAEALRREIAACGGRRQALAQLAESGEGAGSGARALLAAARSGALPGAWQLLAEALRVPPGLERAVEAALGPYAGAVVAESADAAVAALCWLKEKGETAILFAPLPGHGQDEPVGERMPPWERHTPSGRVPARVPTEWAAAGPARSGGAPA